MMMIWSDLYGNIKKLRIKSLNGNNCQYGGSMKSIWEKVCIAAPKLGLTIKAFEKAADNYFNYYTRFGEWREEVAHAAVHDRISVSPFGRIRRLYGAENSRIRQAYNHPAQSGAAHVMNKVMVECLEARDKNNIDAYLQLQIYDDLRWEVNPRHVKRLIKTMVPIMEQPFDVNGIMRTFPTDIEIGTSWGDLKAHDRKEFGL